MLISPRVDVVFKALFAQKTNKTLLLSLINAVLARPTGQEIVEIELLNPGLDVEWVGQKESVLDIRVRDKQGNLYDVEIQCQNHPYFGERVVFYWSRLYSQQLKTGALYKELCPVISIVFTDFRWFENKEKWKSRWMWREDDGRLLTEHGEIHVIELPKFPGQGESIDNILSKWVRFLKEGETMSAEQIQAWKEPAIKKAYEELEKLSQDPEMQLTYETRLKGLNDFMSAVQASYDDGIAAGEKLGLERGEKLGLERGVDLGQIHVLQSLAKKRFPHISEATIQLIEDLHGGALEELAEAILDVTDGRSFRHLLLQLKQNSTL